MNASPPSVARKRPTLKREVAPDCIFNWKLTVAMAPGPVQGVGMLSTVRLASETSLVVQFRPVPAQLVFETAHGVGVMVPVAVEVAVRVGVAVAV